MKFVSLFAGIGGFDLGMEKSGFTCVGQVEIDPYAMKVLRKNWPSVPKHDDVKTLEVKEFQYPDIVVFGSPCQDLSHAGKRSGISGEKSSIFFDAINYIRLLQKQTNFEYPKFVVWENVLGSFSSNGGKDFEAVLKSMVGDSISMPTGGWKKNGDYSGVAFGPKGSAEWRAFDSQYFGVPQRRRRVYLVYNPSGESAGEILLEQEKLRIHPENSRKKAKRASTKFEEYPSNPIELDKTSFFSINWQASAHQSLMVDTEKTGPLDTSQVKAVYSEKIQEIRKITPIEAERLQGFPDGWTSEISDTRRYKLLGNAATVNVVEWIAKRIKNKLKQ